MDSMPQQDPICNMMIDGKKALHVSEANGKIVYLCSVQCKGQNPSNTDNKPGILSCKKISN